MKKNQGSIEVRYEVIEADDQIEALIFPQKRFKMIESEINIKRIYEILKEEGILHYNAE